MRPFSYLYWDGEELSLEPGSGGRRLGVDARCLGDEPVAGACAHVCALADPEVRVAYGPRCSRRAADALAWWIPLLGDSLVCLTTISLDSVHCGGAITVAREDRHFADNPFARLFPGRTVVTDLFSVVAPYRGR